MWTSLQDVEKHKAELAVVNFATMRKRTSMKWVVAGVVILLLASGVVAARGSLGNQTSVSTQQGGDTFRTLAPSNTPSGFKQTSAPAGLTRLDSTGSGVIITSPNGLPQSGYYPKRTYISYDR